MKISLRMLMLLTSIYITLPILIFLIGWTNVWFGLIVSCAAVFIIGAQLKKMKADSFFIPLKTGWIMALFLFVWTLLSGAGHRGFFNGDFVKHNAIFNDLISLNWPVRYQLKEIGDISYLVYYFAYYLPSALIGKWLGWQAGNSALFVWTFIGIVLVFMWLSSLVNEKKQLWYGLLFPLFSGLDGLGKIIMGTKVVNNEWEWWGRNWQYSGNSTLFFYVPQHALIGWLLSVMFLYCFVRNKKIPLQTLLLSTSLLWSPFVFLGTVPFYLFLYLKKRLVISKWEAILSSIIVGVELLFLMSNMTFFAKETLANGWLWETEKLWGSLVLVRLVLFYLFEFGIFSFLIYQFLFMKKRGELFGLFGIAVALLFLLPWYKVGLMNDLAMRASIPALCVISYFWFYLIIEIKKTPLLNLALCSLFAIGSLYSFILFFNGAVHFISLSPRYTLAQLETPKTRKQYLGYSKSIFFTLFQPSSDKK